MIKLTKALYRTGEVARIFRVSPDTIREWIRSGTFAPDEVVLTPGGHKRIKREGVSRLLNESNNRLPKKNIIYARESSSHQKQSLQSQIETLVEWSNKQGITVHEIVTDIASGLNFKRKGLLNLIEQSEQGLIDSVIISYRDRLARFGFDLIQWLLEKNGTKIIIMNDLESPPNKQQEIIDDFVSIIHYFSMRIYGSRKYNKTNMLRKQLLEDIR